LYRYEYDLIRRTRVTPLCSLQRFFNNLLGGISSGLDGVNGPAVRPSFGVTFGTLPNAVQTPFGGGGGGRYVDSNPLGLDVGPVSLNPFVGFKIQKGENGNKVFVPSLDVLVSPNAVGTRAIKNIKHRVKNEVGINDRPGNYYYDNTIPIQSLPYHHGAIPHHQQFPPYPGPYDHHHSSPIPIEPYPPVHHSPPNPIHHPPPIPIHHAPIHPVEPPPYHPSGAVPSVYPPTGPYLPDYHNLGHPLSDSPNTYADPPHYKDDDDVKKHHHVHEHTHVHKGLGNNGGVLLGSFREGSSYEEGLTNIEHLGRQFRGQVKTRNQPTFSSSGPQTFRVKSNRNRQSSRDTETYRIPSGSNSFKPSSHRFTFNNARPNSNSPRETFRVKSKQQNTNAASTGGGFKFPSV